MPTQHIGPPYTGFNLYKNIGGGVWAAVRASPSTGQIVLQTGVQTVMDQPEGVWSDAGLVGSFYADKNGVYTFSAVVNVGPVTMLRRAAFNMRTSIGLLIGDDVGDSRTYYASGNTVGVYYGTENLVVTKTLNKGNHTVKLFVQTYMDYSGVPSPAPYAEIIATFNSFVAVTPAAAIAKSAAKSTEQEEIRLIMDTHNLVTKKITDIESVTEGFIKL